jgi:hypothetical protein
MPTPTDNPGDQPRRPEDVDAPQGPRPGEHPEVARSGRSRWTAIALVALLVIVALVLIAEVTAGTFTG